MSRSTIKDGENLSAETPLLQKHHTNCILVLGAHRSGTSALTRLLNIHGCALPATLMGPGFGNDQGHWESMAIATFNEELLQSAGTTWDDWQPFNEDWYQSPVAEYFAVRAQELLHQEYGQPPLFVLKDPRICRLTPFWTGIINDADINHYIVIPIRDPNAVAASLHERDASDIWAGKLLWLRHVLDAEAYSRGRKRLFATYSQILNDWRGVINKIEDHFGLVFPRKTAISDHEADQFITPDTSTIRPNSATPVGHNKVGLDITSWLATTFNIMNKWADSGEDETDYADLDLIRLHFNQASQAFGPAFSVNMQRGSPGDGVRLRQDIVMMQEQLMQAQAQRDTVSQKVQEFAASNAALIEQKTASENEMMQTRDQLTNISEKLIETENSFNIMQADLDKYQHELAFVNNQYQSLKEDNTSLQSEIQRLSKINAEIADFKRSVEVERVERFREIARISELFLEKEQALNRAVDQQQWLQQVSAYLSHSPVWLSWLPKKWVQRRKYEAMRKKQLFDRQAYLAAYPDVKAAGMDPLRHYILHGMNEGRRRF